MKQFMVISFILLAFVSSRIQAQSVPLDLQTKFILKIVSEDKNFARYGSPIKIGVSSDEALKAFKASEGTLQIKGTSYVTEKMSGPDAVGNYKIVHIGPEWAAQYSAIAEKCKAGQIPMFCSEEAPVASNGGAVGFKIMDGKPKIVVNLGNAKDQGCDFNAGFLKITMVVGNI